MKYWSIYQSRLKFFILKIHFYLVYLEKFNKLVCVLNVTTSLEKKIWTMVPTQVGFQQFTIVCQTPLISYSWLICGGDFNNSTIYHGLSNTFICIRAGFFFFPDPHHGWFVFFISYSSAQHNGAYVLQLHVMEKPVCSSILMRTTGLNVLIHVILLPAMLSFSKPV